MTYTNVDDALPRLAHRLREEGHEVGSRLGERTLELLHQRVILEKPWQREVLSPHRHVNVAAQIAETMWVLAGRNDVAWLSDYLPRAGDFSDDGVTWRGAYGPRLRSWLDFRYTDGVVETFDQVKHVVDLLTTDWGTRRAVISIYDPLTDSEPGKDIPCNDFLSFISRDGILDMSVFVRSNDLIWGWSGINAFEWSALQEILAGILGLRVGHLVFNTTSLHVYDRHWDKARRIAESARYTPAGFADSPRFSARAVMNATEQPMHPVDALDYMIARWFDMERRLREGSPLEGELEQMVDDFPEPMLRSWLRVIAWYWSGREDFLAPLEGTRLEAAVREIPQSIRSQVEARRKPCVVFGRPSGLSGQYQPGGREEPLAHKAAFVDYVDNLHREKSAAYGDSWKKRGEQMSILANIARKNDRLESGQTTGDESSADTAVDYLVYLIKYRLWLQENFPTLESPTRNPDAVEEVDALRDVLDRLSQTTEMDPAPEDLENVVPRLLGGFASLEAVVTKDPKAESPRERASIVDEMIPDAFVLARHLWEQELSSQARATVVSERDYQNPYRFVERDAGRPY